MRYKAVIEIPKGSNRRIHMRYDGNGFEDFGPIKDKIPVNDGVMPVAYGYILNVVNKNEKDNVDAIIFSNKSYRTGDEIEAEIIGMLKRDDNDHKIVMVDDTMPYKDFMEVSENERRLILKYFAYNHKSITLESRDVALQYLVDCSTS
jgi:inorganic pyrophosphatase